MPATSPGPVQDSTTAAHYYARPPTRAKIHFKRPPGYRDPDRTTASAVLVVGFVLVAVALANPWWSVSYSAPELYGLTLTENYLPGGTVTSECGVAGTTTTFCSSVPGMSTANGTLLTRA
jgi:hypothetical protein